MQQGKVRFRRGTATAVILDFDGTVTKTDVVDELIRKFSRGNGWRSHERQWLRGAISSDACLARQLADVRLSRAEFGGFLKKTRLDPGLGRLLTLLEDRSVPVWVLSDGFDLLIEGILRENGVRRLPSTANALVFTRGRLIASFPYKNGVCARCANCKGAALRRNRRNVRRFIFIGDGFSDACAAEEADTIFAKGRLARYCASHGIPFFRYRTLADVARRLEPMLHEAPRRRLHA